MYIDRYDKTRESFAIYAPLISCAARKQQKQQQELRRRYVCLYDLQINL